MGDSIFSSSYLPPDARERLAEYEYRAEDRSYIYKHIWRPACRWLVERLPVWLAPNVITLAALAFVCCTHSLLAYYMPKLTVQTEIHLPRNETTPATAPIPFAKEFLPPPPRYVFVLAAAALLMYQLLDNLDGHQARRTGTSSPLGLLMDHGCDAVNCIVGSLSAAAAVSAGPCWKTWLIVLTTVVVFFLNTWEEYYRDILVLPVVNGPNEGILAAVMIYLWTAHKGGPHWWHDNTVELPAAWLPAMLRQPAPLAAVAVERAVLERVCPLLDWLDGSSGGADDFAPVSFFFNLNCTTAYRAAPPQPTEVLFDGDPHTARREAIVAGRLWNGHSVLQQTVLRAFGTRDDAALRVRYNTIAVFALTALAVGTCAGHVYQVWRAVRAMSPEERRRHGPRQPNAFQRRFPFLDACRKLLPLLVVTLMANAWFLTSQENVFRRHPRIFCWTVGLFYTKLVIHLMVSHLCSCEFKPFRRTLVPVVLFGAHITMTYLHNLNKLRKRWKGGAPPAQQQQRHAPSTVTGVVMATSHAYSDYAYDLDEELILYEFFALSVITFLHLVWHLVRQTAAVLEVPVFTVPAAKQEALLASIAAAKRETALKTKARKGEGKKRQ